MSTTASTTTTASKSEIANKKKFSWNNIGIGAAIQVFEVTTLGQPFEVIKTHMAGIERGIIVLINFSFS